MRCKKASLLYYLYLDESGRSKDSKNYIQIKTDRCKFFTLGGIIVNEDNRALFKSKYDSIIKEYFPPDLPKDFKFHYEELRNTRFRTSMKRDSIYKKNRPVSNISNF